MSVVKFVWSKTFLKHLALAFLVIVIVVFLLLQGLKALTNHGEYIKVPDLAKRSIEEANKLLDEADLRYEILDSTNFNPDYPRYSVIEQNPKAGNMVKTQRKIYLTLNPSGYRRVSVPNVVQVTRRNAESIIEAVGLQVGTVTYVNDIGKDMVLSITHKGREISAGEMLPKTSEIDLVCGNGNRPGSEPEEENNDEGTTGTGN